MSRKRELNLDVADRITELEAFMKKFLVRRILYKMVFRGKGLEFDSYRGYTPNDDAHDIDWKATMRTGNLLMRQYIEERDLKIMFVLDVSDGMIFGSTEKLKCEYAAEIAATLGHLAVNSGDRIGFAFYSDNVKKFILPAPGMRQFYFFVDELSNAENYGGNSQLETNLEYLMNYLGKSVSVVILISDFIRMKKSAEKMLNFFSNSFETIAIMVRDPLDSTMPQGTGEMIIQDPETKEQIAVDPEVLRRAYEENAKKQKEMVKKLFFESGVDLLELSTEKPFVPLLAEFLQERVQRKKYLVPK